MTRRIPLFPALFFFLFFLIMNGMWNKDGYSYWEGKEIENAIF